MANSWIVPTVTALMSGGLVGGLSQIWNAKITSRRLRMEEGRSPADVSTVLLGGASQAVAVLTNSLTWTQQELTAFKQQQAEDKLLIRELMASNNSKDARISEMELELQGLRVRVAEVQTALDRAQIRINEMRGNTNGDSGRSG